MSFHFDIIDSQEEGREEKSRKEPRTLICDARTENNDSSSRVPSDGIVKSHKILIVGTLISIILELSILIQIKTQIRINFQPSLVGSFIRGL